MVFLHFSQNATLFSLEGFNQFFYSSSCYPCDWKEVCFFDILNILILKIKGQIRAIQQRQEKHVTHHLKSKSIEKVNKYLTSKIYELIERTKISLDKDTEQ